MRSASASRLLAHGPRLAIVVAHHSLVFLLSLLGPQIHRLARLTGRVTATTAAAAALLLASATAIAGARSIAIPVSRSGRRHRRRSGGLRPRRKARRSGRRGNRRGVRLRSGGRGLMWNEAGCHRGETGSATRGRSVAAASAAAHAEAASAGRRTAVVTIGVAAALITGALLCLLPRFLLLACRWLSLRLRLLRLLRLLFVCDVSLLQSVLIVRFLLCVSLAWCQLLRLLRFDGGHVELLAQLIATPLIAHVDNDASGRGQIGTERRGYRNAIGGRITKLRAGTGRRRGHSTGTARTSSRRPIVRASSLLSLFVLHALVVSLLERSIRLIGVV